MYRIVFEDWDNKARSMKMQLLAFKPRGGFMEIKRSEEHTSELQSLMRISYVFVLVLVFFYMLVCDWHFIYCYCMHIKISFLK